MGHLIGIDIHRRGVHALQLTAARQGAAVRALAHLPLEIELGGATEQIKALVPVARAIKKMNAFKGKRAVVCLPPEYLSTFPVTFDISPDQPLEAALIQACRQQLALPVEEAVIDYLSVQEITHQGQAHKRQASIVAARQDQIQGFIQVFRRAGLRIQVIDLGLAALLRLHTAKHTLSDQGTVFVHMGGETTVLAVATQNHVMAHRTLTWGADRLQRRLAENMGINPESRQTLFLMHKYGLDYNVSLQRQAEGADEEDANKPKDQNTCRVVAQILEPCIVELVHELYQIIGYARSVASRIQLDEICLYGLSNQISHLGAYLEKRMQITTHCIDPFDGIGLPDGFEPGGSTVLANYVNALGLALREER